MTTALNLASNPFRNRSLPWTVTTVVALLSIVGLIFIARATYQTDAEVQAAEREVAKQKQDIAAINQRAEQISRSLSPEQKQTLKSAHVLVDRKRFSWSRLFADLEAALPGAVRIARITVKDVGAEGDRTVADLDLVVVSKSASIVTQMMEDMHREGIFDAQLVSQNLQRGRGESGEEYEMSVHYTPRLGAPISVANRNDRPVDTAGERNVTR
jgi:Tfp pilus assembly protein PilN